MLLSSDFISIPKVVAMNGSSLQNDQRSAVGTLNLWEKYHFVNSFALYNGVHNQFYRYENQPVPMSIEDFAKLLENNKATDTEGNEYIIERVLYSPYSTQATIDFRVRRQYTNNLQVTLM